MNPIKLLKEKWCPPTPIKESFSGQVVLITGANTGLGLEAAKKVAALNADRVIITTRSEAKASATKEQIEQWLTGTKSAQTTEIVPLVLDMSSSDGVKTFMKRLEKTTDKLHAVVLNAGMNQPHHRTSPEEFEEVLQVNTISTIFLASLLLPILVSTATSSQVPTHLSLVSSRNATMSVAFPKSLTILNLSTPLKTMSEPQHFPAGIAGGQIQYGRSKLLLEYAIRRMTQLPMLSDESGKPYVIINTVCPGATKTDLGRAYEHWFAKLLAKILFTLFAKSAEEGANAYLQALTLGDDSQGQMWAADDFVKEWEALTSEEGKRFGDKVWEDLQRVMQDWDNSLLEVLHSSA